MTLLYHSQLTDVVKDLYISTLRNAVDYNDMMNQYDGAEMDKGMYKHEQDNQKQSKESGI